ncbi:glycosyltransferase family 4 protein [Oryzomicrobium sp.]|uniref:glycosyltransferase family 4 protein n=1 Tax=Oryzomicrobium sp. TaxID=1911578 RepID=UPI0025CD0E48|nr:glycosyltransferase family 4 protein [Oryzomicrobium sp.]MCE1242921.1 glycosyltransferase family 4 protein [Oryzomicrobium sp.]
MKLAIVRQRYTPYGGAERFVSQALDALAGQGIALSLYTRQWPGGESLFAPVICNPFYLGSLWRDWSFGKAVCAALERDRPTLVQSHERIPCCDIFRAGDGVHRVWLDERRRTQSWLGRLSIALNPAHHLRLAAERRLFASPRLKAVICISEMVREEILAHFSIAPDKLHVIYNAVDTERFSPALTEHRDEVRARYGIPGDAMLYLSVGSGYARKGVGPAIEAVARLPDNAHLLVVGKDKHAARYQAQARTLGAAGRRIHFAGPQVDVRPFYGAADAFVLPTLYDPLSNAVLEALACGLPVLTSTKCGAGEIVRAHQAGFLCDARDVPALAANMVRLLDPEVRRTCAERARAAAKTLSAEAMTGRLLDLYRSLLPAGAGDAKPL